MFLAQGSSTTAASTSALPTLLFLLLPIALIYFLFRSNKRRTSAQQQFQTSLSVGEEVVTNGGIYGTIEAIDEDEGVVTLEIAPNVQIKILQAGIGRRVSEDFEEDEDEDDHHDQEDEHSS